MVGGVDTPLKVLFVTDNLLIGGAQDLVKTLAIGFRQRGVEAHVCSFLDYSGKTDVEPLTAEIEAAGVPVLTLRISNFGETEEKKKFLHYLRAHHINVVHSHLFPTDLWAGLLAKQADVPVIVYSKHETYKNKRLIDRLKASLIFNRTVDKAIATSEVTRKHLLYYEMLLPSKIGFVQNPVDTEQFKFSAAERSRLRKELGVPKEALVVGNVARFVPRKGNEYFIETAAGVCRAHPDVYFMLVGYGDDEEKYRQMVTDAGIQNNFVFAISRRDLVAVFSAMDIFMFTSIWGEALSIAMLEAMATERAIVASNIGSNAEQVEDQVSGLLPTPKHWLPAAPKLDTAEMATAVIKLVDDAQLRRRLGTAARLKVLEKFSTDVILDQLETIYRDILAKKKAG